ncbi:TetR/AcrR family transcriptional regulator [Microbacterium sp. 22242]|uniref:TetR/AcrR family transcriptional regulator n=1 Tax=Microbacterium sp. 22242 TaxID=3453896 RepID=UPI003F849B75
MSTKRQQRKQELLSATHRVISERGIAGASVRAVADRAELSPGSILYYFDSFDDLVTAALESAIEEFGDRRKQLIESIDDPLLGLRRMLESGIPESISDELRIVYEVSGAIRDRPQLRGSLTVLLDRQVALYGDLIDAGVAAGVFHPRMESAAIAANLVALEDAYDLYLLDTENDKRRQYLSNALRFAEVVLSCSLADGDDPTTETSAKDAP